VKPDGRAERSEVAGVFPALALGAS
jgi:hypothetical protein